VATRSKPKPITIYPDHVLRREFDAFLKRLKQRSRLSQAEVGRQALKEFLEKYRGREHQLVLDLLTPN
jgi:hypothetical protein